MNAILTKLAHLYSPSVQQVATSLSNQIAEKTIVQILAPYIGSDAVTTIQIYYPYLSKTKEIANTLLNNDPKTVVAKFCKSQNQVMRSITVMIDSPAETFSLHMGNTIKKGSLKCLCQTIEKIVSPSLGQMIFVAAAPVVAPVTLSTSLSGWMAFKLVAATLAPKLLSSSDAQEIEMDDFRKTADCKESEEDDWLIVDS